MSFTGILNTICIILEEEFFMTALKETTLPNSLYQNTLGKFNLDVPADRVPMVYEILFTSTARFLSAHKSKKNPVALVYNNLVSNDFQFAGIVSYHEPEEATQSGNWTLEFTFDEEDIKDVPKVVKATESVAEVITGQTSADLFRITYREPTVMAKTNTSALDSLIEWLDQNAKEGEVVEIELENVFSARVAIEDGEKVFSIIPDGSLKRIVKDDCKMSVK